MNPVTNQTCLIINIAIMMRAKVVVHCLDHLEFHMAPSTDYPVLNYSIPSVCHHHWHYPSSDRCYCCCSPRQHLLRQTEANPMPSRPYPRVRLPTCISWWVGLLGTTLTRGGCGCSWPLITFVGGRRQWKAYYLITFCQNSTGLTVNFNSNLVMTKSATSTPDPCSPL